jgi:ribonuclease R
VGRKKKKTGQGTKIDKQRLLNLFRSQSKPLSRKDIFTGLGAGKKDGPRIEAVLDQLLSSGSLIRLRGGRAFGLTEKMDLLKGTLEMTNSGVGFVLPDDKRRKDIFISPSNLNDAWPGDRVVAALLPGGRKGKNPEGRVVRILERKLTIIPVVLMKKISASKYWGQPTDKKLPQNFIVDFKNLKDRPKPRPGMVVTVQADEKMDASLWRGTAQEKLGQEDDVLVQERIVKINHAIPQEFSEKILQAARSLPSDPDPQELSRRRDVRNLPFVTIDGAKAKDFDDAICVTRRKAGFTLHVAIADVSHYVLPGTPLDREARSRGNSSYFPQSVEPMFPPELSTGLCSLNPQVPRLVMVAEMSFSPEGERQKADFYPAVIVSKARLTYSQVKAALLDHDPDEERRIGSLMDMLSKAETLARILAGKRKKRGSLDFDLPEPEILFNIHDESVDIRPKARHFGHQIIEEFMIAANEAVAEFLTHRSQPCMYRVHPEPDQEKLKALFTLLRKTSIGTELPRETEARDLQILLERVQGSDLEFLVNRLLLRTMMQASYSPENSGHFGLASPCYCHFTSPIRRYADLAVHRFLKATLQPEAPRQGGKGLAKLGEHLSAQERKSMDAEREIIKRMTILALQDDIGQMYTGVIAGVADFGFWVELAEVMAEGLVRLSTLTDDYYVLWPEEHKLVGQRTGRTLTLGQKVEVRLTNTSLAKLEIDLELISAEEDDSA